MADKAIERSFIEEARRQCACFPPGEIVDHEAPDFLLCDGSDCVGIEVTQLFQRGGSAQYPPRQVGDFHGDVVAEAEQQALLLPFDVLLEFDDNARLRGVKHVAASLVEFVHAHPVNHPHTFCAALPAGVRFIRVSPAAHSIPTWQFSATGLTRRLRRDILTEAIDRKNLRVPSYRLSADQVWLLVVVLRSERRIHFAKTQLTSLAMASGPIRRCQS